MWRWARARRFRAAPRIWRRRARVDGCAVSILGSRRHSSFTDGARELFDCAGQGRIDAFFLSGGQIDGQANINLVGVGDIAAYPRARGALSRIVRLGLSLLRGAARDPVSPGAHAARAGRQGRFHQRAGQQSAGRIPDRRTLRAGDAALRVSLRSRRARFVLASVHPGVSVDERAGGHRASTYDVPARRARHAGTGRGHAGTSAHRGRAHGRRHLSGVRRQGVGDRPLSVVERGLFHV